MLKRAKLLAGSSLLFVLAALAASAEPPKAPPKEPATIEVAVAPKSVSAGGEVHVTVRLTPKEGIKINKYPKIKLKVPGQDALVAAAEAAVGNAEPPPPDRMEGNYFHSVDPVELTLRLDPKAAAGPHEVAGQLSYFYCVAASGFCAPAKAPITIPLLVR